MQIINPILQRQVPKVPLLLFLQADILNAADQRGLAAHCSFGAEVDEPNDKVEQKFLDWVGLNMAENSFEFCKSIVVLDQVDESFEPVIQHIFEQFADITI